jgi:hypothetical protein
LRFVGGLVARVSLGALGFALIPFVTMCFSVSLWDRVQPTVLGLPFNFVWLLTWMLLTPLCLWGAYRAEMARLGAAGRNRDGGSL